MPPLHACPPPPAVAATNADDTLSAFSNWGAKSVHLAAPGSMIRSTWRTADDAYETLSGCVWFFMGLSLMSAAGCRGCERSVHGLQRAAQRNSPMRRVLACFS